MNIEAAYQALVDRVQQAFPTWYVTRDFVTWENVPRTPAAMVLAATMEEVQSDSDMAPPKWLLGAYVTLYIERTDSTVPLDTVITQAVQTFADAMKPKPNEDSWGQDTATTLGNTVERARVHGTIEVGRNPSLQTKAVIHVPVEMLSL